MSGPKGYEVRISSAERERRRRERERLERERRERERQELLAQCKNLHKRLSTLAAETSRLGETVQVSALPKEESIEALQAWLSTNKSKEDEIRKRCEQAREKAIVKRVMAKLSQRRVKLDLSAIKATEKPRTKTSAVKEKQSDRIARSLKEDLDALPSAISKITDEDKREALLARVEEALDAHDASRLKKTLSKIKNDLYKTLQAQDYQASAEESLLEIAGIDSPSASQAREFAKTVKDAKSLQALRSVIGDVQAETESTETTLYIAGVIQEVLSDMGYEVGGELEVTEYGAVAYATRDDMPGYALRAQMNPKTNMLLTRIVKSDSLESDIQQDALAEDALCPAPETLIAELQRKNIDGTLKTKKKPGEIPVSTERRSFGRTKQTQQRTVRKKRIQQTRSA